MTNPFAPAGDAVKLEVGDSVDILIGEYKLLDDRFNPGQQVPIISGKLKDGSDATLWCSKKALLGAIGAAMREAGHDGVPEAGAVLHVERTPDGEAKPGQSAPHQFTASYKRPAAAAPKAEAPAPAPAPAAEASDPADFFAA